MDAERLASGSADLTVTVARCYVAVGDPASIAKGVDAFDRAIKAGRTDLASEREKVDAKRRGSVAPEERAADAPSKGKSKKAASKPAPAPKDAAVDAERRSVAF